MPNLMSSSPPNTGGALPSFVSVIKTVAFAIVGLILQQVLLYAGMFLLELRDGPFSPNQSTVGELLQRGCASGGAAYAVLAMAAEFSNVRRRLLVVTFEMAFAFWYLMVLLGLSLKYEMHWNTPAVLQTFVTVGGAVVAGFVVLRSVDAKLT